MFLFKEIKEMLGEWPWGTICGILIILVTLALAGLAGYGIFYLIDSVNLPRTEAQATITGKPYSSEQTITQSIPTGNTVTVTTQTIPEEFGVNLNVNGKGAYCSVKESFYNKAKIGDQVRVIYVKGRISGKLYIKKLYGK